MPRERKENVFLHLAPQVRTAIEGADLQVPTEPQQKAIPAILRGDNVLLTAPTGSGKTEACILPVFSEFLQNRPKSGISILYITPLRALNRDMLRRMTYWADCLNISVEVRHGDTSQSERRRQAVKPPDMLITTPETLQAILPGRLMRQNLATVRWAIVDEVHELAEDKRGTQLTLALERVRRQTKQEFQRIGISATIGSPSTVAQFIAGTSRPISTIVVYPRKSRRYFVERPIPGEAEHEASQKLFTSPEAAARLLRIKELVDTHNSTLIFVNSRQNAEMLALRFNILGKDIGVHHGSLSREERHRVEDELKSGDLRGVVCTSTLELGLDIGSIDLVVQYLSPRQVSPLIQRVGRSGHSLDRSSQGVVVTAYAEDTLESMALVDRAMRRKLESTVIHEEAFDVLAHQLAGLVMDEQALKMEEAFEIVKQAYPFRNLQRSSFQSVIDFLASIRKIGVFANQIERVRGTRTYYFENLSMIPDERLYQVIDITTDQKIGILGEEFMTTKARVGLNFICRGLVWQIVSMGEEGQVYVKPVDDPLAAIPGWDGEMLPVPFDTAQEVGRLRRRLVRVVKKNASDLNTLYSRYSVERHALRMVLKELKEAVEIGLPVPDDELILLEGYDHFIIVHGAFGDAVNRTLGYIADYVFHGRGLICNWWADGYRLLLELSHETTASLLKEFEDKLLGLEPSLLDSVFRKYLDLHFPFGYQMKFVAQRFGLLPRGIFLDGVDLSELWQRFQATPVGIETIREARTKKVDIDNLRVVLEEIRSKKISVTSALFERPTPWAYYMLNRFAAVPETMAPETVKAESTSRLKKALEYSIVHLLCIECGHWEMDKKIIDLEERPHCPRCNSALLGAFHWFNPLAGESLAKRLHGESLSPQEQKALVGARRSADVVLSYGRKGIVAMSVHGIGPQTASRILAKMHAEEADFYEDLLDAKLHYLETRQYWDES